MKRLEAITRTDDVAQGLQARLADPLWLIGRQWQVGELTGEDAASPVLCTGELEHAPATRLRAGKTLDLTAGVQAPLEALIEREAVLHGDVPRRRCADERETALRRAALSGQWLMRSLRAAVTDAPLLAALARAFAFVGDPPADPGTRLLVCRSPSGGAALALLARVASAEALLQALALPPSSLAAAGTALTVMRRWRDGLATNLLGEDIGAWDPAAAAHAFQIDIGDGGPVLQADDHRSGRLDWHSVRIAGGNIVDGPAKPATPALQAIPRSVRYAGMPASRFWEFEDARVYFGGWRGGTHETVRWLLAEFAVVYGDDWFIIPVDLPYGHLVRVRRLTVRDCFGETEDVGSVAAADGPERVWRFLELTGDIGPEHGRSPWLWVAPVLPDRQEGDPVEELLVLRDETLNLAWGVEQRVEGPDGRAKQRARRPAPPASAEPGTWTYHLTPPFPPGWTPLLLEEQKDGPKIRRFLRRGRLPGWTADDLPRGRLLDVTAPYRLVEAAVPRGGLVITRSPQRARSPDGQVWTWVGRETSPGAGLADGALRFDDLERP